MVILSMSIFNIFDLGSFLNLFEPGGIKSTVKLHENPIFNKSEWQKPVFFSPKVSSFLEKSSNCLYLSGQT